MGGAYNPGDSILFKAGDTWSGSPNFSAALITPFAGSSGNPITYGSYGTGPSPILDGGNSLPTLITISHDYITITGLQLQNSTKTWVTYSGTTGTRITYVTGKNAGTWGFYGFADVGTTLFDHTTCTSDPNWTMIAWCFLGQGNGPVTFTNNTCDLRNLEPTTSHAACIQSAGSSNTVIQYNYAYGGQQAFAIKPGSINPVTVTGGLIADNYAYQIVPLSGGDAEAIELTGAPANPQSGITVTRNVIVCKSGPGGTKDAIGQYYSSNDIVSSNVIIGACGTGNGAHISSSSGGIYSNNTFSGGPGTTGISVYAGCSVTANNNIFDNFTTGIYCHGCASATEDYNLYNTNVATPVNGTALGSHSSITTDPQFVTSTPADANDVKLQATSPAIGAGADLGPSLRSILDPQGTAVPFGTYDQSSAWMMGAFGHAKQTMTKIAGDNQSDAVNSVFPTPLQISIKDSDGNPVPGATVTFSVVAGSSGASGTFSSSATIATDSNGSATAPDLTSNSVAGQFTATATHGGLAATFTLTNVDGPQISLTPSSLSFGSQDVNTTSAVQPIKLSNASSGALMINSIAITGTNAADFSQTNNCGNSVAAGASCTISVTFSPQAAGSRSGSLTVTDDAADSPHSAALSGSGVAVAQISLTPSSLSFGNQNVKTASAARAITLSNAGSAALAITSIAISGTNAGDFSQTNTCGTSVAAGASCTISVKFTPQAAGARSASLTVTDNAAGSPHRAALNGTGIPITLTPSTVAFGNQRLKTASSARTVTLSNIGSSAVSITRIAFTGTNAADFSQTNTCGTSVVAGGSCTISVKFTPQAAGARSASLAVTDNAAGSPHTAALSGTGVPVTLTPSTLAFGNQKVKTASTARTITLANIGTAAVSITRIAFTGTNAADFSQTNTCGSSVAAGGSCTISIKFTPQATGTRSASLSITDNAAGSPHTAALSGTGTP
jgi:Abnormal spindle-like microcephaly-assoc'd, ASPM-SPD-2-Hydin